MPFGVVSEVGRGIGVLDWVQVFQGKGVLLVGFRPQWFE